MIVTTIDKIKESTGINKNIAFATMSPYIMQAEQEICRKVVGNDLYAIIDAGGSLSTEQEVLKGYLEIMISNFAVYFAFPQLNINVSELGVQQNHSNSSAPVSTWQCNEAKQSYFRTGDIYREISYKYLQENQSDFTEWVSSTAYTYYNAFLIRSNEDLNEVIGKGESVGTFVAMHPYLELAQAKFIRPVLCETFLQKIIDNTRTGDALSSYEIEVRRLAKNALGWYALFMALPSIRCIFVDGTLVTSMPSEASRIYAPISAAEKNEIMQDAYEKALNYTALLKDYLKTNSAFLEDYTSTSCYQLLNEDAEKTAKTYKGKHSFGLHI